MKTVDSFNKAVELIQCLNTLEKQEDRTEKVDLKKLC